MNKAIYRPQPVLLHYYFLTECFEVSGLSSLDTTGIGMGEEGESVPKEMPSENPNNINIAVSGLQPSELLKKPCRTQKYFSNTAWHCKINCSYEGHDKGSPRWVSERSSLAHQLSAAWKGSTPTKQCAETCLVCYPFHSDFAFAYQCCIGVKKKINWLKIQVYVFLIWFTLNFLVYVHQIMTQNLN